MRRSPWWALVVLALSALGVAVWLDLELPLDIAVLGVVVGLTYAIIATAISLTDRISGVLNLAIAITALLGLELHTAVLRLGLPWILAILVGLVAAFALSAATEVLVVRRLSAAPRPVMVMATAAFAIALIGLITRIRDYQVADAVPTADKPPLVPSLRVGDYVLGPHTVLLLILVPIVIIGTGIVNRRTRMGLMVVAAADDRDLARIGGLPAARFIMLIWGLAGLMTAAVLILGPFRSEVVGNGFVLSTFGVDLGGAPVFRQIIWPVSIAALARGRSGYVTVAASLIVAALEQALVWESAPIEWLGAVVVVGVVASILLTPRPELRAHQSGSWAGFRVTRLASPDLRVGVRRLGRSAQVAIALIAVWLAAMSSVDRVRLIAALVGLAVIAIAIFIDTGLAGGLSLIHIPIAAMGAASSILVMENTGAFPLALVVAVALGIVGGGLAAVLDLRGRGLPVLALSMTLVITVSSLFETFAEDHAIPGVPVIGTTPLSAHQMTALFAVLALLVVVGGRNLGRSLGGRALLAQRDNPDAARAFGLRLDRLRITSGAVAGAIAALGGVLVMQNQHRVIGTAFSIMIALAVVFAALLGGLSSVSGAVVGVMLVFGVPMLVPAGIPLLDLGVGLGGLMFVLAFPTGLMGVWPAVRHRAVSLFVRFCPGAAPPAAPGPSGAPTVGEPLPDPWATQQPVRPATTTTTRTSPSRVLVAEGLSKSFGGVRAVDDVSLSIAQGEIVSLIGSNGAGKTTTFDLLTGFLVPDAGRVLLDDVDIGRYSPSRRAGLGLVRTFQDAALFPSLTVTDVLELAGRGDARHLIARGIVGLDVDRARRRGDVAATIRRFGLEPYASSRIVELSTGTRRIVELASAHLLNARVLLLDEPSAGIAQREVEALGNVLVRFRDEAEVTLVVIEHDIPFCRQISDRMIAMVSGRVVAEGSCVDVVSHPRVIESYLGANASAIARSGPTDVPNSGHLSSPDIVTPKETS